MNRLLLTFAACVVLALGAMYIAPHYIEWNNYRHVFEDQVSRMLGREVRVEGNVNLKLLPAPYLEFQRVQVMDSPEHRERLTEDKPLFANVKSFKLWLAIPPLLQGIIKVKKAELTEPAFFFRFDQSGRANWRDIAAGSSITLPYMPTEVSFDSVKVSNGIFYIHQAGNTSDFILENVTGELSAETLKGPYKFKGSFSHNGEKRKLSFASGKQNKLGIMRVKSLLEIAGTGSLYAVEGELKGFNTAPSFKGKIQGKLPLALLSMLDREEEPRPAQATLIQTGELIDIRSNVSASLRRVELKELAITVQDQQRPQSLNGTAILDWNRGFNLQARLKASWLDLDQMLGTDVKTAGNTTQKLDSNSVQSAFSLFSSALQNVGNSVSRAAVNAEIVDAKLGGSQLGNFRLHLTKNLDQYRIAKLSMQLPGRNHLEISGDLTPHEKGLSFSGPVSIKGISLGALSHWAFIKDGKKNTFQSNPYFLQGGVNYSQNKIEIANLRGDLNGARVSGAFRYDFGVKKQFVLELDSDKVDLQDVVDKKATLKSLLTTAFDTRDETESFEEKSATTEITGSFMDRLSALEGRINLRVGRIQIPDFTGRDIVIDGRLSQGKFALRSFKMISEGGLVISGKGQINDLKQEPQGNVRFSVEAQSASGLQKLAQQIELPESVSENQRLMKDLSPLRLAITLNMQSGGLPSTDISIAGTIARSQLTVNARHEGAVKTLGSKQLELSGSLINANASELINQLIRDKVRKNIEENGQGSFSVQASGIPEKGLDTRARLDAGSTQANFDGVIRVKEDGNTGSGKVSINSSSAAAGLSLIGFDNLAAFSKDPLKLSANLVKKKTQYLVSNVDGRIGSISIRGDGRINDNSTPVNVQFKGSVSTASLPGLMGYFSPSLLPDDIQQVVAVTGATLDKTWSNRPFDLSNFSSIAGRLDLKFNSMSLGHGLTVRNGEVSAVLDNGKLTFNRLNGRLLNGPFSASGTMTAKDGPVSLQGKLSLKNADLAELFKDPNNQALARGTASVSMSFAGEGLSPLGLVSELRGKGQIRIREGEIFNFSPDALSQVIGKSNGKENDENISRIFLSSLKGRSFPIRNIKAPVSLNAGMLKVKGVGFSSGTTKANASALLELSGMKLDSKWDLTSRDRGKSSLGVSVVFAGALSKITALSPIIDSKQLRENLAVRKIEQNLDTMQKLDERDPETIKRLQSQSDIYQKQLGNQNRNKFANQPQNANQLNRNNSQPQLNTPAETEQAGKPNGQLPALTNLGSIDQNNSASDQQDRGTVGSQYSYDKQQGQENRSFSQLLDDEEEREKAEILKKLEEEKKRKKALERKKRDQNNFFDSLFNGG